MKSIKRDAVNLHNACVNAIYAFVLFVLGIFIFIFRQLTKLTIFLRKEAKYHAAGTTIKHRKTKGAVIPFNRASSDVERIGTSS